jgi:hypothetical protein
MTKSILTFGLMLFSIAAQAQQRAGTPATSAAPTAGSTKPAAPPYKQPKTSWGEPDISGMWPLNNLVTTQLQRNARFGDRLYLTDEEFKTKQDGAEASRKQKASGTIPVSENGDAIRQTSLIVDPPNGQFPALTDYGKQLQEKMNSSYKPGKTVYDSIEDFGPWDRCITRGLPVSMEPRNYNNGIFISQSPGYVTITTEMAHESRVIPTSPLPRLDPSIKQWLGESRGHWEGNTLIVETTNFNGLTELTSAGVPGSPGPLQPSTPNMKITERFTRTGPDSMDFSMKIEDSTTLAPGSFTVAYPMKLDNSYEMFEYACHEGNTAVRNYIETSRFERANPKPPAPAGAGAPAGGRGGRGQGGGGQGAPGGRGAAPVQQ